MQCDGLTKQSVFNEVVKLKGLEQKYKDTALKVATNKELLEALRMEDQKAYQAENEKFAKHYADMVRDEVQKELKTPELKYFYVIREREPDKFAKIENEFQAMLKDFNTGPRAAAKRAVEFMHMKEQVSELRRVKAENDRLRKSVGLSRKIQDAPLRPQAGHHTNGKSAAPSTPLSRSKTELGGPTWRLNHELDLAPKKAS
jgi:predicted nucleotidyltransferase